MKKSLFIIIVLIIIVSLFIVGFQADASKFHEGLMAVGGQASLTAADPAIFAANIVKTLLTLVGIVFVILIIYGGFIYMTSAGVEDKVKKSKKILTSAVIGIIIITSGYTITHFIASNLESPGESKPNYREECENSGSLDYYSINCCEYRYLIYNIIEGTCCEQTPFYDNHEDGCGTTTPPTQ